jgi:serine/threonine-protein kinase
VSEAAESAPPDDPFDGRYAIVRELGAGGVGRVWEAVHAHTGRRVALKMLRARFADDPRWAQRFLREARAVARIRHPNVVEVLDMSVGRAPFIVYELLEGDGLDARLAAAPDGRLDVDAALRALVPVAAALSAAHAEGIVHRDLKPSNVFLARDARGDEVPKVIDFGLAKHTSDDITVTTSDMVLGTPAYMAPEQSRSEPDVDAQAGTPGATRSTATY